MSKNLNSLALRRRSIRTLTPAELRVAQGGGRGNCGGTGKGTNDGGTGTNNTGTKNTGTGRTRA